MLKPNPYILPATEDLWPGWEKSFVRQAQSTIQAQKTESRQDTLTQDAYTHESGYGPSPMDALNEDLAAFDADWESFSASCAGHMRRLPAVLAVAAVFILFLWLMGAFGPADAATASFYTDHTSRPCSNGHSYASNSRRYHGLFGASNRYRLGSHVSLVSRSGRRVTITIADHMARGQRGVDCSAVAFRRLVGSRYRTVGRVTVRAREIGR